MSGVEVGKIIAVFCEGRFSCRVGKIADIRKSNWLRGDVCHYCISHSRASAAAGQLKESCH